MTDPADREFLRSAFLMEAWDALGAIEAGVARLAAAEPAPGACDALFVDARRLERAAALHGMAAIADLAGRIERSLAALPGAPPGTVRSAAVDLAALVAELKASLETPVIGEPDPVRAEMQAFIRMQAEVAAYFAPEAAEHLDAIAAALGALARGGAPARELPRLFRAAHTLKGAAYVVGCARMGDVAHRLEDLLVAVREGRVEPGPPVLEAAHASVDALRLMLDPAREPDRDLTACVADAADRIGALLTTTTPAPASPSPPLEAAPSAEPAALSSPVRRTIRVSLDRIDTLLDQVGELVAARARLEQGLADLERVHPDVAMPARAMRDELAELHRVTTALRRSIGRARLVPVGTLFTRFVREGREAARGAGTEVRFETSGESVELDASVVEQIVDPLVHLVRNAIAHGIETAEERRARGKPPAGLVTLTACHHGSAVFIEVRDDGRGIDHDLLRRRAVALGLLRPEDAVTLEDREALELIFRPGFSTAPAVTALAGRGIGMDVVRANVERLGGEVDLQTEVGAGTRFTLEVPLTLLASEGLFVRAGGETFALPLTAVQKVVSVPAAAVERGADGETVTLDGRTLRVLRLDEGPGAPAGAGAARRPIVVLRAAGFPVALHVDEVLQREEIVVRPLGPFLEGVGPFGGTTIGTDGRVTLVLDPLRLARRAAGRAAAPSVGGPRTDARRRVLLVDDSISVRRFVGRMLTRAGFGVTTAVDGAEALRLLAEGEYEVVVTDLEMPGVDGYALIEDIRRRPTMRGVPVVVLSTRAGDGHAARARRLGVAHYVTKPVEEQMFVRLIESLVAPARGNGLAEAAR